MILPTFQTERLLRSVYGVRRVDISRAIETFCLDLSLITEAGYSCSRLISRFCRKPRRRFTSAEASMKNLLSLQLSAVVSFVVLLSSASCGQTPDEERQQFFAFMGQVMDAASAARSAPVTEPGIPQEKVNGNWVISVFRSKGDAIIGTYVLEGRYKFYAQAWICGEDRLWDGTLLGEHETAATFYQANLSFVGSNSREFMKCLPPHFHYNSPPAHGNDKVLYTSEDRVLSHMANWLFFLAKRKDAARSADFMRLILAKYKKLLVAADGKGDLRELADTIQVFDSAFPVEVFDLDLPLGREARADARDFFQTMLLMRRKLKVISPASAGLIARDEALLDKLR
jgi:hypothetical protein